MYGRSRKFDQGVCLIATRSLGFIGSPKMNFLPATAVDAKQVTLGLRPEHLPEDLMNTSAEGQLEGEVIALEHLGSETYVHLACSNDQPLMLKSAANTAIEVGQRVSVAVPKQACYLFDENGMSLPQVDKLKPAGSLDFATDAFRNASGSGRTAIKKAILAEINVG